MINAPPFSNNITSTNGKLNVVLWANAGSTANLDTIGSGYTVDRLRGIDIAANSQIVTNGGYFIAGGGATPTSNPAIGGVYDGNGFLLESGAMINTAGGNASISATPNIKIDGVLDAGSGIVSVYGNLQANTKITASELKFYNGALNGTFSIGSLTASNASSVTVTNDKALAIKDISASGAVMVTTTTGNVILNTGAQIVSNASGNAIIIAPADSYNLINNAGGSVLTAANGRWIIYSDNAANTTLNGLTAANTSTGTYATLAPTNGSMPSGNVVVYKIGKMIMIVIDNQVIYYGDNKPVFTYTVKKSDTGETVTGALTAVPVLDATGYTVGTGVGNYTISATNMNGAAVAAAFTSAGYTLGTVQTGTLRVDPKALNVTGITAENKEYNGNATATVHTSSAVLAGKIGSDVVSLVTGATGSFADKNVGIGKTVTVSGLSLTGAAAANYTLGTVNPVTANITAKPLNVTGITADNRVYTGYADATVQTGSATLSGKIGSDVVSLGSGIVGSFADKNVGTGKAVAVSGLSLMGGDSANYILGTVNLVTANITAKALNITGLTAENKEYNGNATATVQAGSATLSGKVGSDVVSLGAGIVGSFTDKNVGTGKSVTISGLSLTGAAANNYTLGTVNSVTANITAKDITVQLTGTVSKQYDGTTVATLQNANYQLDGKVTGDTVVANGTGVYDTADIGDNKTVSVTGIVLSGADVANYSLPINIASGPIGKITNVPTPTSTTEAAPYNAAVNSAVTNSAQQRQSIGNNAGAVSMAPATADGTSNVPGLNIVENGVNTNILPPTNNTPASAPQRTADISSPKTPPAGINNLILQVGSTATSLTITETGKTLTIAAATLTSQENLQRTLTVFKVGATGSRSAEEYIVNSRVGSIDITSTTRTVADSNRANPTKDGGVTSTFSIKEANGKIAKFVVSYAEGSLDIQPANQVALLLMSEGREKQIIGVGMVTAQTELGIAVGQVETISLEQTIE